MLLTSHVSRGQGTQPPRHRGLRKVDHADRVRRGLLAAATLAVLLGGFSGCTTLTNAHKAIAGSGAWNDTVMTFRNRSFSAKAWHRRKHHFCKRKYLKDFCAGFRAGYEDIARGADGCTPAFPPKNYWSWEFQSAEGQARTAAWFEGYPHGARAAEEEGLGNWSQLQMSSGLQAQYQNTGMFEHDGALYPIPATPGQGGPVIDQQYLLPGELGEIETIPPVPSEPMLIQPPQ